MTFLDKVSFLLAYTHDISFHVPIRAWIDAAVQFTDCEFCSNLLPISALNSMLNLCISYIRQLFYLLLWYIYICNNFVFMLDPRSFIVAQLVVWHLQVIYMYIHVQGGMHYCGNSVDSYSERNSLYMYVIMRTGPPRHLHHLVYVCDMYACL